MIIQFKDKEPEQNIYYNVFSANGKHIGICDYIDNSWYNKNENCYYCTDNTYYTDNYNERFSVENLIEIQYGDK